MNQALVEHGDVLRAALTIAGGIDEAIHLVEGYRGTFESKEDYAEELFNEVHDIPAFLAPHIDWSSVARDLECDGTSFVNHEGQVHVFDINV